MNDNRSLAHTKWNCKYHVVFAAKYRRKIFYREKKAEIGKVLRELCSWKDVNIIVFHFHPYFLSGNSLSRCIYKNNEGDIESK